MCDTSEEFIIQCAWINKMISNFNFNNTVSQKNLLYLPSTVMDNKEFIVRPSVSHFCTSPTAVLLLWYWCRKETRSLIHCFKEYTSHLSPKFYPFYSISNYIEVSLGNMFLLAIAFYCNLMPGNLVIEIKHSVIIIKPKPIQVIRLFNFIKTQ